MPENAHIRINNLKTNVTDVVMKKLSFRIMNIVLKEAVSEEITT